jgi:hypothetical protein
MSRDYIALLKAEKTKYFPLDSTDKTDKSLLSVLSVPQTEEKNTFVSFVSCPLEEKKSLFQIAGHEGEREAEQEFMPEERAILRWLSQIGEGAPKIAAEVLEACRQDMSARRYFLARAAAELPKPDPFPDDRRRCAHCLNFLPNGVCKVAVPGGLVSARRGFQPVQDFPRRCAGYRPCLDDPDRRLGLERWPAHSE